MNVIETESKWSQVKGWNENVMPASRPFLTWQHKSTKVLPFKGQPVMRSTVYWQPLAISSSGSVAVFELSTTLPRLLPANDLGKQRYYGGVISGQCKPLVIGNLCSGALCQAHQDSLSCTSASCSFLYNPPSLPALFRKCQTCITAWKASVIPAYFLLYVSQPWPTIKLVFF